MGLVGELGQGFKELKDIKTPMTLALMGCAVNGPGEATHTDLGIAFGKGAGHLYYKGKRRGRVKEENAISELKNLISEFEAEKNEK